MGMMGKPMDGDLGGGRSPQKKFEVGGRSPQYLEK